MTIGERIKEKRLQKKYTLEKLANEIGVTKSTVLKYENGSIAIPSDKIEKIAKALKVSPGFLMGWEENTIITKEELLSLTNERYLGEIDKKKENIGKYFLEDYSIEELVDKIKSLKNYKTIYDLLFSNLNQEESKELLKSISEKLELMALRKGKYKEVEEQIKKLNKIIESIK